MASTASIQVGIDHHHQACVHALQRIAALADTGSREHKERFDFDGSNGIPTGWRVAEAMRDIAVEAVDSLFAEDDPTIYKRAFDSMAAQMIHPKMTGLEMAKMQLGEK